MDSEREDTTIYKVVVNHEEQYSIWPAHKENALGWKDAGKQGTKEECLAYIKEVWTDMRPLSLRKKMEEMERLRQQSQGYVSAYSRTIRSHDRAQLFQPAPIARLAGEGRGT